MNNDELDWFKLKWPSWLLHRLACCVFACMLYTQVPLRQNNNNNDNDRDRLTYWKIPQAQVDHSVGSHWVMLSHSRTSYLWIMIMSSPFGFCGLWVVRKAGGMVVLMWPSIKHPALIQQQQNPIIVIV